jgi:hypothetical protein
MSVAVKTEDLADQLWKLKGFVVAEINKLASDRKTHPLLASRVNISLSPKEFDWAMGRSFGPRGVYVLHWVSVEIRDTAKKALLRYRVEHRGIDLRVLRNTSGLVSVTWTWLKTVPDGKAVCSMLERE